MCEAPSTCRASTWLMPPWFFIAEYSGLLAAPGSPNVCVAPSFSRMSTMASTARIRAMTSLLWLACSPCAADVGRMGAGGVGRRRVLPRQEHSAPVWGGDAAGVAPGRGLVPAGAPDPTNGITRSVVSAGQALGGAEQPGVVQVAVARRPCGDHQLGQQ